MGIGADGPRRYIVTDLHLVDDVAGVYAWYVEPPLTPEDIEAKTSSDDVEEWFLQNLRRFASFFAQPPVSLTGRSTYDVRWQADITAYGFGSPVSDREQIQDEGAVLGQAARDADQRRIVGSVLNVAIPAFASPIYIGVAGRLRQRLEQHLAKYDEAQSALRGATPEERQAVVSDGSDFGTRLAAAEIPLERLSVWTLTHRSDETLAPEKARKGLEAAEWVLQRVYRPPMGKR